MAVETRQSMSDTEPRSPRVATLPDLVWGPLAVGSLLLAVGLIGLAAGQPWLFPSLGPTAFLQAEKPGEPSARFYNTVVGHLVGLGAGLAAVLAAGGLDRTRRAGRSGAGTRAGVGRRSLGGADHDRAFAAAPSHPPAAATMLLVALGGFEPTWKSAGTIVAGVLIVAILGEGVRFLRREVVKAPPSPAS